MLLKMMSPTLIAVTLSICLLLTCHSVTQANDWEENSPRVTDDSEAEAVRHLIGRLLPQKSDQFLVAVDHGFSQKDAFQISSENGRVSIRGNRGYTVAAGLHHYLKFFCGAHVSWSGSQLNLPEVLPLPQRPLSVVFHDKYRYYQNVCTSSYSYVWWNWSRWEHEIDWMALNGINLALAFNAQEAIYYKIFKQLNFTDHDIEVFFTGPAFLAWNRMGNLQAWGGSLSSSWHQIQLQLQRQILQRMRSFGMKAVLPAFSGRVPSAFNRVFPDANTTFLNKTWGNFQPPFGFVKFLEPSDPLFLEIGAEYLRNYIAEFGTDHIYNADLFNEMPPPSTDPTYLHSCAKEMFKTLTTIDPEATWMIQGWMFYSDPDIWKPDQARSFLRAVPQGKMLVLDLQSELYPQYQRLQSYYGQPFIWCMLHNYGGVSGLYASLDNVNTGPFEGRNFNGSSMVGTGITPEGIETNDIAYELMNEMAWRPQPVDMHEWLSAYCIRRYGNDSGFLNLALLYLRRSVYNATVPYRNHGKYIIIKRPSLKLKPYVWYNPVDVFIAWELFLNASSYESSLENSTLYRHDLVDITRQSLQLVADVLYSKAVKSYRRNNITSFRKHSKSMTDLFDHMDELLATNEHFLLGKWLNDAAALAHTPLDKRKHEYNARNQITIWGPAGELIDYANKQWSGLMSQYYKKRWVLFFDTLDDCLVKKKRFLESDFNTDVFEHVEYAFNMGEEKYPSIPQGDSIEISRLIYRKYKKFIEKFYHSK